MPFPKSIRWQIQAWHAFLLVCIVAGLIVGFYHYERHSRFSEIDTRLHRTISPLLPQLAPLGPRDREHRPPDERRGRRPPPDFDAAPGPGPRGPMRDDGILADVEHAGFYYMAWNPDGSLAAVSSNAPADVPLPNRREISLDNPLRSRGEFRELIHFVPNGHRVLLGTSTAAINGDLRQLALWLTLAGVGVIAIGLAGGWWIAGRAIRPIHEISSTAQRIANGKLSDRINVSKAENELTDLGKVLNNTFERLERNFEQQVRFTADASHELRTPVSVILTQIQLALSRERTLEEYQKTLQTCERAAERMRALVNQLLELARIDAGEDTLVREKCDLARVVCDALEFVAPLAESKNVTLKHAVESIQVKADAMKLGQVLINLLNNAIQHNEQGIELRVSMRRDENRAFVYVADNGSGISAEALPHLFDRFYRADKSRSRNKGSNGLGLAICKTILEAHGGKISVSSQFGHGTEFVIELPL